MSESWEDALTHGPSHSCSLSLLLGLSEDALSSSNCKSDKPLCWGWGSAGQRGDPPPSPPGPWWWWKPCSKADTVDPCPLALPLPCVPSPCVNLLPPTPSLHLQHPRMMAASVIQGLFCYFVAVCSGSVLVLLQCEDCQWCLIKRPHLGQPPA